MLFSCVSIPYQHVCTITVGVSKISMRCQGVLFFEGRTNCRNPCPGSLKNQWKSYENWRYLEISNLTVTRSVENREAPHRIQNLKRGLINAIFVRFYPIPTCMDNNSWCLNDFDAVPWHFVLRRSHKFQKSMPRIIEKSMEILWKLKILGNQ